MREWRREGTETMPQAIRVASVSEIPAGTGKEVVAGGRVLAVFNVEGTFHAIDGICAHAGGPLGKGALTGCVVTCPWHGWQYDVTTGRHRLAAQIVQASIPVRVSGDDVFVELP